MSITPRKKEHENIQNSQMKYKENDANALLFRILK
jgi:hypothetical protein